MNCSRFARACLILAGICLLLFCFNYSFGSHSVITPVQYYSVVPTNSSNNTWRAIIPNELYVYSAFYALPRDNDQVFNTIKVIAIVNRKDKAVHDAITCSCIFGSERISAMLQEYPEHHSESYTAASITCPAPVNISRMELRCQLNSTFGSVDFDISPPPSSLPQPLSMAVCGPTLFGSDVRAGHLVEFVEYYRMMGVSHFFLNVYYTSPFFGNVTVDVVKVLEHYENLGLMSVGNWTIPVEIERKVHYNGQVAALNECMLKATGFWDYVVVVDIDEFIISQHGASLSPVIQEGSQDCTIIRHTAIKSSLSPTSPPGSLNLRLQRHLHRDALIWDANARSKYICRPRSVLTAGIHFNHEVRTGTRTLVGGNVEEMLMLHFSEGLIDNKTGLVEMDMDGWFGLVRLAVYGENVNGLYRSIFNTTSAIKM